MQVVEKLLVTADGDRDQPLPVDAKDRQTVHLAAAALIALTLSLRAWSLLPSWFYADDHRLLSQAREHGLSLSYLTTPFDSQYMPFGRLVAWIVAGDPGTTPSWGLATCITLLCLAGASGACWWMLVACFGCRWENLLLLALFLTSTLALPATMWWAASLNQIPLLIAWCGCVAAGVTYLRTTRWVWLGVLLLFLLFGFAAYVKAVLVLPVLAFIAYGYFTRGTGADRVRTVLSLWRWAVLSTGTATVAFLAYYRFSIPQPFSEDSPWSVAGPVTDTLIGTSWATATLGGPWRWDAGNAPIGTTNPWDWSVHLSWVLLAFVIVYSVLQRERSGRAWVLLALCLSLDLVLLLGTRAPFFGAIAGNEMRYLTESAAALALCLGLAFLPLRGALEASAPRPVPALRRSVSGLAASVACLAVVASSLVSSVSYVRIWHDDNPGEKYLHALGDAVRSQGHVELVDAQVPDQVMPPLTLPYNRVAALTPLYAPGADYPQISGKLLSVTPEGRLATTVIEPGIVVDDGPIEGCGWKVPPSGRVIKLPGGTLEVTWWVRIAYLSSGATPVTVTAGSQTRSGQLHSGLGSLYVMLEGGFDEVRISGLSEGTTLCVDRVEVGTPTVGSPVS